jgi:hypothetical protein
MMGDLPNFHRHQIVYVDLKNGPDENGKFVCLVNGGIESWSLDRIKVAVKDHDDVREWER